MAKFDGKFLIGTLGNAAFRKVGKEQIVQTRPGRGGVKQTPATKGSGAEFGLASSSGRVIREAFSYLYGQVYDGTLANRLTGVLAGVIRSNARLSRGERDVCSGDISRLAGFEFNSFAPLRDILLVRPQTVMAASGIVKVGLPAFNSRKDLRWAPKASECRINVMAIAFDFNEKRYRYLGKQELQVSKRGEEVAAQEWTFSGDIPEGCLLLTGISLEFFYLRQGIRISANSREYTAAELTGAFLSVAGTEEISEVLKQPAVDSNMPVGWVQMSLSAQAMEKLQKQRLQEERDRMFKEVTKRGAFISRTVIPEGWLKE